MLEVGRIAKPHGLKGEVVVDLVTNRTERVDPGSVLSTERGDLTVERSSPFQGRWIVAFAGVHTREQADELRGTVLSAEPLPTTDDGLWVHELIGSAVVDTTGAELGRVDAVQANPASDLLVLDGGGLVPLRFVVSTEPGRVMVDVPPGLLD
ncbi:MAG TPA: ribosome maturation factor RimM [Acidimicrobiales bacterium]|nr:ribosome maturation factor RimM [Acidimicrobiales bacterium]